MVSCFFAWWEVRIKVQETQNDHRQDNFPAETQYHYRQDNIMWIGWQFGVTYHKNKQNVGVFKQKSKPRQSTHLNPSSKLQVLCTCSRQRRTSLARFSGGLSLLASLLPPLPSYPEKGNRKARRETRMREDTKSENAYSKVPKLGIGSPKQA